MGIPRLGPCGILCVCTYICTSRMRIAEKLKMDLKVCLLKVGWTRILLGSNANLLMNFVVTVTTTQGASGKKKSWTLNPKS